MIGRIFYHGITPFVFSLVLALIFRYGEIFGGYCGHAVVFAMLVFLLFSFVFDHKEEIIDMLFWGFLRLITYTGFGVLIAIFFKEILNWIKG